MLLLSSKEMQAMDHRSITEFNIPGRVLMENAGRGATEIFLKNMTPSAHEKIAVIAGKGNNGGDGFVIARYLFQMGYSPTVFLLSEKAKILGDAGENLDLLMKLRVPIIEITKNEGLEHHWNSISCHQIFIDAIFGTGLHSEIKGMLKELIERINSLKKRIFSVDIPSGVSSDNGSILGTCIKADLTATFAYPKMGHILFPGATFTGKLEVVDIGIPKMLEEMIPVGSRLLTKAYIREHLPHRPVDAHKGTFGHLFVIAGSEGMAGAAAMTSISGLRSGSGVVTLALPHPLSPFMDSAIPEVMIAKLPTNQWGQLLESAGTAIMEFANGKSAIAIGPGMGCGPFVKEVILSTIENSCLPMVIDADGLNHVAGHSDIFKKRKGDTILTPHPGEMARLAGTTSAEIQRNRIEFAKSFAQGHGVHLVLKGARTLIAHPDGSTWVNPTGNPGMATAGMGDVLTGVIAGFLSQGIPARRAARIGVYIHGMAADLLSREKGPFGYLATDVSAKIPEAIAIIAQQPSTCPSFSLTRKMHEEIG